MEEQQDAKSYADYLRIPELLDLQGTLTDAHDELQFIIVHQAFELWFKLSIFELEALREAMKQNDRVQTLHLLSRLRAIVKLLTSSFEVIETMRPYDFLQFRNRLMPASGLQSLQFREVEFICGLKDERYYSLWEGEGLAKLKQRAEEDTLWDAYLELLKQQNYSCSNDAEIVESVMNILKDPGSPTNLVTEAIIEFDELFSIMRERHLRMVMRMIGNKPGTGQASVKELAKAGYDHMGSGGTDYLRSTMSRVFFPLMWEARTFMSR
jgi:tryptophan 2,3-dioxygenase